MNQIDINDMFRIIGRQRVEIELMTRELERMKTLAQSEQNRANEAQLLAKRLYHQQNGAVPEEVEQIPT